MQISELLGAWLNEYRQEHSLTLSQIADAARKYGARWRPTNIMRMEEGRNGIDSLPTLMILLATLNDLTGDDLTMADIFIDYAGKVELSDRYATSYENIVSMLQGKKAAFTYASGDKLKHEMQVTANYFGIDYDSALQTTSLNFGTHEGIAPGKTPVFNPSFTRKKHFIFSNHIPTAAERRLEARLRNANPNLFGKQAKSKVWTSDNSEMLGLAVAAICDVLYGHSLDEESAKRAGEGATPQKRGHVTRVLEGEILDYMRKMAAKMEE